MAVRVVALVAALGTLAVATGCGGTPVPGSPEDVAAVRETVRRHEVAVFAGDGATACGTTTGVATKQLMRFNAQPPSARRPSCEELIRDSGGSLPPDDRPAPTRDTVGEVNIDGDAAVAVIDPPEGEDEPEGKGNAEDEERVTFRLRRTDDGWTISDFGPVVAGLSEAFGDAADALNTAWRLDCRTFRFDPAAWRRAQRSLEDEAPTASQRLADALIKCRSLLGRTREEVTEMLGAPDPTEGILTKREARRELSYTTGPERSFISIDSEVMTILLDREGRVRRSSSARPEGRPWSRRSVRRDQGHLGEVGPYATSVPGEQREARRGGVGADEEVR